MLTIQDLQKNIKDDALLDRPLAYHRDSAKELVRTYFKDDQGQPIELTDGQADIFNLIAMKLHSRVHIESVTRFGKSLTVALAILVRITTYPEKFSLVAGTKEQSAIIMGYIIQHIFDHEYFRQKFQMEKGESEEFIRRHKNKSRINFVVMRKGESGNMTGKDLMGEVFITNAAGAMGFGAPNVILDEAALVKDTEEALVFRMLGDSTENFYFKIGNPWESGHFRKSHEDKNYYHIIIDWKRAVKEGRLALEQVEEARSRPFFDVLFECKFPPRDKMDDRGWMPLLTQDDIDRAIVEEYHPFGINKMGADIAGGGKNFSVIVQRHRNVAKLVDKNNNPDTMDQAERIISFRRANLAGMDGTMIDCVGQGKGVADICMREIRGVVPFNGAESPPKPDDETFTNMRAYTYWKLREWILSGGKLLKTNEPLDDTWYQLTKVKYRQSIEKMRGKLQIQSKEDMLKEGVESPDVADAIAMTFATADVPLIHDEERGEDKDDNIRRHGLFPKV